MRKNIIFNIYIILYIYPHSVLATRWTLGVDRWTLGGHSVDTRRTLGVDRWTLGVDRWTLGGHSAWIRLLISVAHITLWILVKRVADFR